MNGLIGIKVTYSEYDKFHFIDFHVDGDEENVYRYEEHTGKMRKVVGFGVGNRGKAIRGKVRKQVEALARTAYENRLPFAFAVI